MSRESDQSSISAAENNHLSRITDPVFAINTDFEITYANPTMEAVFGSDRLTGRSLTDIVASGQENRLYIACETASKHQNPIQIQISSHALVDPDISSIAVTDIPDTAYHARIFPSETGVTVYLFGYMNSTSTDTNARINTSTSTSTSTTESSQQESSTSATHERDHLVFMNQIIRHDLLNGLNVISARADILSEFVESVGESHLETVNSRVNEMVTLLEVMQSITDIKLEDNTHSHSPQSLQKAVQTAIDALDTRYRERITVSGSVPDVTVQADEHLSKVFSNLFASILRGEDGVSTAESAITINAYTQNDPNQLEALLQTDVHNNSVDHDQDDSIATTAVITITSSKGSISIKAQQHLTATDINNLASPDDGFGLYLVGRLIDSYDGSILVNQESENKKTIITVVLLQTD